MARRNLERNTDGIAYIRVGALRGGNDDDDLSH
jgi:hypothetical protein